MLIALSGWCVGGRGGEVGRAIESNDAERRRRDWLSTLSRRFTGRSFLSLEIQMMDRVDGLVWGALVGTEKRRYEFQDSKRMHDLMCMNTSQCLSHQSYLSKNLKWKMDDYIWGGCVNVVIYPRRKVVACPPLTHPLTLNFTHSLAKQDRQRLTL